MQTKEQFIGHHFGIRCIGDRPSPPCFCLILPTTQRLSLLETLVQVVFHSNVIVLDCIDGSPGQVTLDQIIAVIVLFQTSDQSRSL